METKHCIFCEKAVDISLFYQGGQDQNERTKYCAACERKVADLKTCDRYGLTYEAYKGLQLYQDSYCAICHERMFELVVDHDHVTGEVRGLLCTKCNNLLGHFRDNTDALAHRIWILRQAIGYLMSEEDRREKWSTLIHD